MAWKGGKYMARMRNFTCYAMVVAHHLIEEVKLAINGALFKVLLTLTSWRRFYMLFKTVRMST